MTGGHISAVMEEDCYRVYGLHSSTIITDSQLAALLEYAGIEVTPPAQAEHVVRADDDDQMQRTYHCECDGKEYTSRQYREWEKRMASAECDHKTTQRGAMVPPDYPDGWSGGWCSECFTMLAVIDSKGTGI